ncbi:hypothetical protein QZH41_000069 [Actinostola sp. cb2023]|nr:hypothetical protein QZH41_000069 [Actinostola sp. cb2023]
MDQEILDRISKLLDDKLNQIISDLNVKIAKIEEFERSLNFLSKFDDLDIKIEKPEFEKETTIQQNIGLHSHQLRQAMNSINQLKVDLNNLEQYSRRDCLEIQGVPMIDEEDTNQIVSKIGELLDIDIELNDISVSHRLGVPNKKRGERRNQDPGIIVKVVRRDLRDKLYHARKHLCDKSTRDLGHTRFLSS